MLRPTMLVTSLLLLLGRASIASGGNPLPCPPDKSCTFLENCSDMLLPMRWNELPINSFRRSICDYAGIRPKVCCDASSYSVKQTLPEENRRSYFDSRSRCACGSSLVKNNIDIFGSYPFLARIGFVNLQTGRIKYPCSGTILNERTVVTTASCALANSEIYKLYVVTIGEFNSETDPDCNPLFCGLKVQHRNISYIVKHPNYRANTFANNIALIRLEKPIQFTATAQPVCLLSRATYVESGSSVVLIGWGRFSNQKETVITQQELKMALLPKEKCSYFSKQGFSVESCAIGEAEPCSGYNGSPLLYKYSDNYFLAGILSYGSNCDDESNLPTVFVNAQEYARWLVENL